MQTQNKFGRLARDARLSSNQSAAMASLYSATDRSGDALGRQTSLDAMCGQLASAKASRLAVAGYAKAVGLGVVLGVAGSILLSLGGCAPSPAADARTARSEAVHSARKALDLPFEGRLLNTGEIRVSVVRSNDNGSFDVCGSGLVPMSVDRAAWTVHVTPSGEAMPAIVGEFTRGACGLPAETSFAPTVGVPCELSGLADIPGACDAPQPKKG